VLDLAPVWVPASLRPARIVLAVVAHKPHHDRHHLDLRVLGCLAQWAVRQRLLQHPSARSLSSRGSRVVFGRLQLSIRDLPWRHRQLILGSSLRVP